MEVKWSTEALGDLRRIYIQHSFKSRKAAQRICAQILSEANILINHPMAGKKEPSLKNRVHLYRSLVTKIHNYKLVYYVEDNLVRIICVWDCRRNPGELYKMLTTNK
ncbi:type II toxin-antitoxin system RelE/ParE family toxin [Parabacteroides sp. OttesenSCG-928-K15]|nr:type II toxin-antitoxin system RelE/ParE family toxin [Parabacteroides sp. OttesenSCG-928-K15]